MPRCRHRRPREAGDHGGIPEDRARVPGDCGRIPGDRARTPGDRARTPGDRGQGPDPSRLGRHGTGWHPDAREPGTGGFQGARRAATGWGGGAPRPGCRLVYEPDAPKSRPRTVVRSWQALAARPRRVATASVARSWRLPRLNLLLSVAVRLRGSSGCPARRWRWRVRPQMGARFAGPLGPMASVSFGALHRSPSDATSAGSRPRPALVSADACDPMRTSGWSGAAHRRRGSGGHAAGLRRRGSGGHAAGLHRRAPAGHARLRRSLCRGLPPRDWCAVAARRNRTRADPGLGSWIHWSRWVHWSRPTSDSSPDAPRLGQR
jgi:hypothetical protein